MHLSTFYIINSLILHQSSGDIQIQAQSYRPSSFYTKNLYTMPSDGQLHVFFLKVDNPTLIDRSMYIFLYQLKIIKGELLLSRFNNFILIIVCSSVTRFMFLQTATDQNKNKRTKTTMAATTAFKSKYWIRMRG